MQCMHVIDCYYSLVISCLEYLHLEEVPRLGESVPHTKLCFRYHRFFELAPHFSIHAGDHLQRNQYKSITVIERMKYRLVINPSLMSDREIRTI